MNYKFNDYDAYDNDNYSSQGYNFIYNQYIKSNIQKNI